MKSKEELYRIKKTISVFGWIPKNRILDELKKLQDEPYQDGIYFIEKETKKLTITNPVTGTKKKVN